MKVIQTYILSLNFCEGKNHKHLNNTLIYKAKHYLDRLYFTYCLHILQGGASSVQICIEHTIVYLFLNMIALHQIDVFLEIFVMVLHFYNENKKHEKESNFNISKVINLRPKP